MTICTLKKWNETPVYQEALDNFLKSPAGRAFLEVLADSAPVINRGPVDSVMALQELGRLNHHHVILRLILSLTVQPDVQKQEPITADFSASPLDPAA